MTRARSARVSPQDSGRNREMQVAAEHRPEVCAAVFLADCRGEDGHIINIVGAMARFKDVARFQLIKIIGRRAGDWKDRCDTTGNRETKPAGLAAQPHLPLLFFRDTWKGQGSKTDNRNGSGVRRNRFKRPSPVAIPLNSQLRGDRGAWRACALCSTPRLSGFNFRRLPVWRNGRRTGLKILGP